MSLLDKLRKNRPAITWAETAAILHDIGKLSKAFIDYRQKWRKMKNGYDRDPHNHEFLGNDAMINKFGEAKKWFETPITFSLDSAWEEKRISVADAINRHIETGDSLFLNMLKSADAKDAAIDRNNPFFSADQKEGLYATDVFGVERPFNIQAIELSREGLYSFLNKQCNTLPDGQKDISYEQRESFLKTIKAHFDEGFSDTTRPDNDTTLWEHCYAVASIFKIILIHYLIYGEKLDGFDKVRFGILGVGWDALDYLSHGHKIGDIVGRKSCIDELKQKIRETIEHDYLVGNTIYEDDNGIYFLVPALTSGIDLDTTDFDELSDYGKLLKNLEEVITDRAIDLTGGELLPKFHLIQDTTFITHLVRCISALSKKCAYPIRLSSTKLADKLSAQWAKAGQVQVCPVCKRRPIKEGRDVCSGCEEIRRRAVRKKTPRSGNDIEDTVFISEICSGNRKDATHRRAALIVAKIRLEDWLNGRLVRSLLVSEASGFERELSELGRTKHFETVENEIKQWLTYNYSENLILRGYDYQRICDEIDRCFNYNDCTDECEKGYAKNTVFLYDRRNPMSRDPGIVNTRWDAFRVSAMQEYDDIDNVIADKLLYNVLCAKTPTPSTILDIWNTTQKFFTGFGKISNGEAGNELLGLPPEKRWTAEIEKPANSIPGATYEGVVKSTSVEVVWPSDAPHDRAWVIGDIDFKEETKDDQVTFKRKLFKMGDGEFTLPIINPKKSQSYFPCRIITATPDMFMAIVPADKALNISQNIYDGYLEKFGKVIGRLPISIGNIFFRDKLPIFVVLDAGRRMLRNFENLHNEWATFMVDKNQPTFCPTDTSASLSIARVRLDSNTPVAANVNWKMPVSLGNDKTDYYHPYVMVAPGGKDYSHRKHYFKTVMGDVIHCTEIAAGDILKLIPNYYDFEFLDSNTRRHEISMAGDIRRKSSMTDFISRPIMLDELQQKIIKLWDLFTKNDSFRDLTDAKLRNLQSLWLSKHKQWQVNSNDATVNECIEWMQLVESSLLKELGMAEDFHGLLRDTIKTGLFFDVLELHLGILKEKIDRKGGRK